MGLPFWGKKHEDWMGNFAIGTSRSQADLLPRKSLRRCCRDDLASQLTLTSWALRILPSAHESLVGGLANGGLRYSDTISLLTKIDFLRYLFSENYESHA